MRPATSPRRWSRSRSATLLPRRLVALAGQAGGLGIAFDVRWYYLLGGVLGAAYVTTALITVKEIGAGGVAAATITGQLTPRS